MAENIGKIVQVLGAVLDVEFEPGNLPEIMNALFVTNPAIDDTPDNLVIEVQLTAFLAGKAVAAGLVVALTGGVALVIGFLYHDIAWVKLPSSLFWITASGVALFAWFGALQMLASTQRAANLLTSMLLFPLLMAGGSFFPFAALPDWIAAIGRRTPNGFVVDRLSTELTANAAWTIDPQSWLIITLMAASGLAICAWRLRTGFAQG